MLLVSQICISSPDPYLNYITQTNIQSLITWFPPFGWLTESHARQVQDENLYLSLKSVLASISPHLVNSTSILRVIQAKHLGILSAFCFPSKSTSNSSKNFTGSPLKIYPESNHLSLSPSTIIYWLDYHNSHLTGLPALIISHLAYWNSLQTDLSTVYSQ